MSTYFDKAVSIPKEAFFDYGYFFEKDKKQAKLLSNIDLRLHEIQLLDVYYRLE